MYCMFTYIFLYSHSCQKSVKNCKRVRDKQISNFNNRNYFRSKVSSLFMRKREQFSHLEYFWHFLLSSYGTWMKYLLSYNCFNKAIKLFIIQKYISCYQLKIPYYSRHNRPFITHIYPNMTSWFLCLHSINVRIKIRWLVYKLQVSFIY